MNNKNITYNIIPLVEFLPSESHLQTNWIMMNQTNMVKRNIIQQIHRQDTFR